MRSLIQQDGISFSGVLNFSAMTHRSGDEEPHPIEGDLVNVTYHHKNFGGPGYCWSGCLGGAVIVQGRFLWVMPAASYGGVPFRRLDMQDGNTTQYTSWPKEVKTFQGGSTFGAAFDAKRGLIWPTPALTSHLVKVDVANGEIGYCHSWPSGARSSDPIWEQFVGTFIDASGEYLFLAPLGANMIVRVAMADCGMTGLTSWPAGFTHGFIGPFRGALSDGDEHGWFIPAGGSHVVKLNLSSGRMYGHRGWPKGYTTGHNTKFSGGALADGSIFMGPYEANMAVEVDRGTGAMKGHSNWPIGWTSGVTTRKVGAVSYDGKYVWLAPMEVRVLVRLDKQTGAMQGFLVDFGSSAVIFDFAHNSLSLWLPKVDGGGVYQLTLEWSHSRQPEQQRRCHPHPPRQLWCRRLRPLRYQRQCPLQCQRLWRRPCPLPCPLLYQRLCPLQCQRLGRRPCPLLRPLRSQLRCPRRSRPTLLSR